MATPTEPQTIKIELTLSEIQKTTLEKAAATKGLSLNDYILNLAIQSAAQEVVGLEQIVLSQGDWEIFTSTLENPPEPIENLKAAMANYQKKYGNNDL
jgi:uncharacterized protein (DUF1778 family)